MDSNTKLTQTGKLFFASLLGWINGKKLNIKLKGNPDKVQALADAVIASKKFQEALKDPNATVQQVLDCMAEKKEKAKEFTMKCGIEFPL